MLKIGVLGAGHLGKIHLACLESLSDQIHLIGFHDPDPDRKAEVIARFGIAAFDTVEALIDAVDVVDIVTPTVNHFSCAAAALSAGKHVFIEKPITHTVQEGEALQKLAADTGLCVQVGHVERFNPALQAVAHRIQDPKFIEAHRLSPFQPRGTDVPVVLDLMIHDLDVVLSLVNAEVAEVRATGAAVLSATPDIANARIAFDNGCVANLTASRISLQKLRKMRIFQPETYITMDFLDKKASVMRVGDGHAAGSFNLDLGDGAQKHVQLEPIVVTPTNAIREELAAFVQAIERGIDPPVRLADGVRALGLAYQIMDQIERTPHPSRLPHHP